MTPERSEWHLWNWQRWMEIRSHNLGYPKRSLVIGRSGSTDFDAMVATADSRCALATDAVIDGLTARERAAIYHIHMAAVFVLRGTIEDAYADAVMSVGIGLTARGIL